MSYEKIEVGKNDVDDACMLSGTVTAVDTSNNQLDVDFGGDIGELTEIDIHYHCQDLDEYPFETDGYKAFEIGDSVLCFNNGGGELPTAADLKVVGFADGVPRECKTRWTMLLSGGDEVYGYRTSKIKLSTETAKAYVWKWDFVNQLLWAHGNSDDMKSFDYITGKWTDYSGAGYTGSIFGDYQGEPWHQGSGWVVNSYNKDTDTSILKSSFLVGKGGFTWVGRKEDGIFFYVWEAAPSTDTNVYFLDYATGGSSVYTSANNSKVPVAGSHSGCWYTERESLWIYSQAVGFMEYKDGSWTDWGFGATPASSVLYMTYNYEFDRIWYIDRTNSAKYIRDAYVKDGVFYTGRVGFSAQYFYPEMADIYVG